MEIINYPRLEIDSARNFSWGLALILIDITAGGFDIAMDLIGYIIIAAAAGKLLVYSRLYASARKTCAVCAILWLLSLPLFGGFSTAAGFALAIANLVLTHQVIYGTVAVAEEAREAVLAHRGKSAFNWSLATQLLAFATLFFAMVGGGAITAVITAVAGIVAFFKVLGFFTDAVNILKQKVWVDGRWR